MSSYFDYAAATPISPKVLEAMQPYFSDNFYNPSAQYLAAQNVRKAVEQARADVAQILGARTQEIHFTAGGTEANNLAIKGVRNVFTGEIVVTTAIEHDSVLYPVLAAGHRIAPVKPDGRVDVDTLINLIDDRVVLVSVMYANNEIGTVQPISEIAKRLNLIKADRKKRGFQLPLYLHIDACQAPNYLPLLVNTLGVDMMTLNGGKIYGPKQSGVLYIRTGLMIEPIILGGGQEHDMRSGTENVAAIIGFATALKEATLLRGKESARVSELQHAAVKFIKNELPNAVLNGAFGYRLPNNIHITIPGVDNERMMMELDEKGFQVAVGSACSASSDEPSHVLKAIGLSNSDARASLRISFGRETTEKNLSDLLKSIVELSPS